MAFCKYCGKQLEENEVCGCPQSEAAASAAPQYIPPKANDNAFVNSAKVAWESFLNIMKKPADGCADFVKKSDMIASGVLLGVQSLIYAILAFVIANKVWEKEAFKVALIVLVISAVYAVAYAGIMMGAFSIAKSKLDFAKALGVTAVKRIPCTLAAVVTLLLFLIEVDWYAGPIVLAVAFGLMFVDAALDAVADIAKNVKTTMLMCVTAVAGIVVYLIYSEIITDFMKFLVSSSVGSLF